MAFKSDLVDVGPPPYPIVPLPVAPLGVLRSIQPTPEQKAAVLAAVRGQPAPAGTAPPPPLVNKSTKTSTPQRNSTLGGTTALFEQLTQINELRNLLEASRRQLASEQASRAAVESQLTALRTQRTEKDLDEFILDPPLVADLRAELAAAQAKCTALEQENERLRRMSELLSQFETRAEEADLENVKLKAAAGEGERSRSELMDKLAASAARLEQKEAALVALQGEKDASESTAQQRSATLQEELKEAREKLAQQATELEQMAVHRNGFTESTNAMHAQLTASKKANGDLQGRIAQLTTERETLRGELSASETTNVTLKTSNEELNERLNETVQAQESRVAHLVHDSMKVARAEIEALKARLTQSSEEGKRLADDLATALREQSAQVEAQVAAALALHGMQNQGGAAAGVGTGASSEAAPTAAAEPPCYNSATVKEWEGYKGQKRTRTTEASPQDEREDHSRSIPENELTRSKVFCEAVLEFLQRVRASDLMRPSMEDGASRTIRTDPCLAGCAAIYARDDESREMLLSLMPTTSISLHKLVAGQSVAHEIGDLMDMTSAELQVFLPSSDASCKRPRAATMSNKNEIVCTCDRESRLNAGLINVKTGHEKDCAKTLARTRYNKVGNLRKHGKPAGASHSNKASTTSKTEAGRILLGDYCTKRNWTEHEFATKYWAAGAGQPQLDLNADMARWLEHEATNLIYTTPNYDNLLQRMQERLSTLRASSS